MRNVFLAAAQELRNGMPQIPAPRGTSPGMARAMSTSQWWDSVAIRVDSQRADGMNFTLNFLTPDNGERFVVEMSGATLSHIQGFQAESPDATVSIERERLNQVIMGNTTLEALLQSGQGSLSGNADVLTQLNSVLVNFAPGFEILPGTGTAN